MPLDARLNTIESASSTERLSASLLEISGTAAPGRTATPSPTRPRLARSAATLPAAANSSSAAGGAITTSNASPPAMRLRISGAVLNVIFTSLPVCFLKAAAAALKPGSTAPALRTLISAAIAPPVVNVHSAHKRTQRSKPVAIFIFVPRESQQITTTSLGARTRVFHHFRPFRDLARDVFGEVARRTGGELRPQRFEPLAQIAHVQHTDDVRVEPFDEGPSRGRRHDHPVPG